MTVLVFIFCGNKGNLDKIHAILNSLHRGLKFTMEYSDTALPILDIVVKKKKCKI